MADITYTVNQDDPNNIDGFEQFSQADKNLVDSYVINSLFDSNKNTVELHILSLADELISSIPGYTNYKLLGNAQSAGTEGASIITIDPVEDCKLYGYETGGVKLLYHFLNDLYSEDKTSIQYYIDSISPDRTEIRLISLQLTNQQVVDYTATVKKRLVDQSYFKEFRLNFGNNDLLIGINIDTIDLDTTKAVAVKLYEPLPIIYDVKSTLSIVETVSDSVAYEVDSTTTTPPIVPNTLRPANFNLEIVDEHVVPTQYFSYTDLFSYPVNNANNEIYSLFNEKGVEISIDHSDYSNFIHFSSAQERLMNFKYKIQLVESYSSSLAQIRNTTSQSVGITGSISYYEGLTQGIVSNFDHYERFLYYESSSYAWPKVNTTKPYINVNSADSVALTWYANQLTEATKYDASNYNALINTIPTYLRDDPDNDNYLVFVHMIGQHFDTIWQYAQSVTDKYDADNRLNFGISKDLVGEALKNFGVKLYTSNNSIEDLFGSFIGQAYQSGSEDINYYITGSLTGSNTPIQPSSYDNYNKEIQKRIYHNLSHLVKTKGTERGLRALINCFGIPSDILKIKLYGGRNVDERPFYGDYEYYTSSLDKIRLDHTGSLISGSTLSSYTSIYKRDPKYTDDLHNVEIGFSPTDNVDNHIVSYSLADGSLSSFNIDDYIGDPRNLTLDSYALLGSTGTVVDTLTNLTNRIMSSSDAYNVFDYVRLIKFFDNTIFKMVRDFIPARVTADTGIIIKPHLLQRNKAKSPSLSGLRPEHSGSIDTAFIESTDGETFGGRNNYITSYIESIQTPDGPGAYFRNSAEQPRYNGEFSGSTIDPTNGELNEANPYKDLSIGGYNFQEILFVSSSNEICLLSNIPASPYIVTSSTFDLTIQGLFNFPRTATVYSTSSRTLVTDPTLPGNPYSPVTFPFNLTGYTNYSQFYISASSVDIIGPSPCTSSILVRFATCSLFVSQLGSIQTVVIQAPLAQSATDLRTWFDIHPSQTQVQYTASYNSTIEGIPNSGSYLFTQDSGTSVEIKAVDPYSSNCQASVTVTVGVCTFSTISTGSAGLEFDFSEYGNFCPPNFFLDPNSRVEGIEVLNSIAQAGNQDTDNILNGNLFNQYGIPTDPCIAFKPAFLQRPRSTQYGIPPPGFIVQEGKDRGLQTFLSPYIPAAGMEIPEGTYYNVYRIINDPNQNLIDESKYIHTPQNPSGSDLYLALLEYSQIDPFVFFSGTGVFTSLTTALGGGIAVPTTAVTLQDYGDVAIDPSPYATRLRPIYVVTPPSSYLKASSGNSQTVERYTIETRGLARGGIDGRVGLPVAYHIQVIAPGGVNCNTGITVYPSNYTRILAPSSVTGLGIGTTGGGTLNWDPVSAVTKYIFVNKNINIGASEYIYGPAPQGALTPLQNIPIRKRAFV